MQRTNDEINAMAVPELQAERIAELEQQLAAAQAELAALREPVEGLRLTPGQVVTCVLSDEEALAAAEYAEEMASELAEDWLAMKRIIAQQREQLASRDAIDVVFDGPPGPVSGRFVEVEDGSGRSVHAGEWVNRGSGFWALRIKPATGARLRSALQDIVDDGENEGLQLDGGVAPPERVVRHLVSIARSAMEGGDDERS